jgi:hypothetical protein
MIPNFTGTDQLYVTLLNGLHTESISPAVLPRLIEFLDLYVGKRTPNLDALNVVGRVLATGLYGTAEIGSPPNRFADMSYEDALAAFEAEPKIQVLFEQGPPTGSIRSRHSRASSSRSMPGPFHPSSRPRGISAEMRRCSPTQSRPTETPDTSRLLTVSRQPSGTGTRRSCGAPTSPGTDRSQHSARSPISAPRRWNRP